MRFQPGPACPHEAPAPLGVLLLNLGTPDAPTSRAVRRYLAAFLRDPRVVELPRWLWWPLLYGLILPFRAPRSARLYQAIWGEAGSPLLVIGQRQRAALEKRLQALLPVPVQVALAMRYGNPSVQAGLEALRAAHISRLLVLPLYPQYAAATTGSAFDAVAQVLSRWRRVPEVRFIAQYPDFPPYLHALAERIRQHWADHGKAQRLLFSFHGIPQAAAQQGDPYFHHCQQTAQLLAKALELSPSDWAMAFQSRMGKQPWLQPYTDRLLRDWGASGVSSVQVCCPGFAADCLETLEEIARENRRYFLQAGGQRYEYIPALNDSPAHVEALAALVQHHAAGWLEVADRSKEAEMRARAES